MYSGKNQDGKKDGFTRVGVWKFYTSNHLDNSEELENAEDWITRAFG